MAARAHAPPALKEMLVRSLNATLAGVAWLFTTDKFQPQPWAAAMAAAHWEAVRAVAGSASDSPRDEPALENADADACIALAAAAVLCPVAVALDPTLLAWLDRGLARSKQARHSAVGLAAAVPDAGRMERQSQLSNPVQLSLPAPVPPTQEGSLSSRIAAWMLVMAAKSPCLAAHLLCSGSMALLLDAAAAPQVSGAVPCQVWPGGHGHPCLPT